MPSDAETTIFCLHHLGGSRRSWEAVEAWLPPACRVAALDLPGFGDNAHLRPHAVADMADHVADAIRADAPPGRFVVAGHSMGAKIAIVLARRAADGEPGLGGLAGLVLVAGSPPSPEPIPPDRRQRMLSWFRDEDAHAHREQADEFVGASTGGKLPDALHARAADDVLRASAEAWRAWLEAGSKEDWSARVGVLAIPALIVSGGDDADLGPDAQASLTAPHFTDATLVTLDGAGHLLPLEAAEALAGSIARFVADLPRTPRDAGSAPPIPDPYRQLIDGPRVSTPTRTVLLGRAEPVGAEAPRLLAPPLLAILDAVLRRVLPQEDGTAPVDLARRIDLLLASGGGDGWRFAAMPPDGEAMRRGLQTLDAAARAGGRPYVALEGSVQDELLGRCAAGTLAACGPEPLDAEQMSRWFEKVRALAVRAWIPHPATLARLGYSGIAYGGDGPDKQGFRRVGLGEREEWEPVAP